MGEEEQRMDCFIPFNHRGIFNFSRIACIDTDAKKSLGPDEINKSKKMISCYQVFNKRPQNISKFDKDFDDFTSLSIFELPDLIICFQHIRGFNKNGLAGRGLVMNKTTELSFKFC